VKTGAPQPKTAFTLSGFSYQHFNSLGQFFGRVFYQNNHAHLEDLLEDAGLKIFPEAYYSMIGFVFILLLVLVTPISIILRIYPLVLAPLLVIPLGYLVPKTMAQDRAQKLDLEVPFAGTYISVMATGGMSPYDSLKRLKDCNLLPNISKVTKEIEVDVQIKGFDPVSAIEKSAKHLPSKDYKDLMLGYVSTLKTGGDIIHYLLVRTDSMFKDLAIKVKAFGERASVLMESYVTISILMTLTLAVMFMTTLSLQQFWQGGMSPSTFQLYGYLLVPAISILFIYISDSQQISQPINDWATYKVFFATLPVSIFLAITMFIPFATGITLGFAAPFSNAIISLTKILGLDRGYEASLGLAVVLLVTAAPSAIAHSYYARLKKGVEKEVSNFMRDLTETRKTGASPEACIENLAGKDYGRFTPILVTASRQIRWGLPFGVIYETFRKKIKSWIALVNIYLLVDAIEVGGGTPETLETVTRFSESLSSLEKEKKESLRPLLLLPYIGTGILLFATIILLSFSRTLLGSYNQSIPFSGVVGVIMPPLIMQIFFVGLVTGKFSSGETSAGFKHSVILLAIALVMMPLAGLLTLPFKGGFT
jgi:flagellar protein FlaJ